MSSFALFFSSNKKKEMTMKETKRAQKNMAKTLPSLKELK
jgi:hypothetical protein